MWTTFSNIPVYSGASKFYPGEINSRRIDSQRINSTACSASRLYAISTQFMYHCNTVITVWPIIWIVLCHGAVFKTVKSRKILFLSKPESQRDLAQALTSAAPASALMTDIKLTRFEYKKKNVSYKSGLHFFLINVFDLYRGEPDPHKH
jgi:hypothetical protein